MANSISRQLNSTCNGANLVRTLLSFYLISSIIIAFGCLLAGSNAATSIYSEAATSIDSSVKTPEGSKENELNNIVLKREKRMPISDVIEDATPDGSIKIIDDVLSVSDSLDEGTTEHDSEIYEDTLGTSFLYDEVSGDIFTKISESPLGGLKLYDEYTTDDTLQVTEDTLSTLDLYSEISTENTTSNSEELTAIPQFSKENTTDDLADIGSDNFNTSDASIEISAENITSTSEEVIRTSEPYDETSTEDITEIPYATAKLPEIDRIPDKQIESSRVPLRIPILDRYVFDKKRSDKEILDHLLNNSTYDKRLLPQVGRGPVIVTVDVLLLSLASPDESSLKYEVEFLVNQQWVDPRLNYGNSTKYHYLNALHHTDKVWIPDTYFIMHGDFKDPLIPVHFALTIFRNGTITYTMRRHLILSCRGEVKTFPFDDPECKFALESISYESSEIHYTWKNKQNTEETLRTSPSYSTLNAYLISKATLECETNNNSSWRGNYSCLQVDLTFSRDRTFYFTTVFIPGIILVTSSFVSFWLEWNAVPARSMIGVTTMLNFFTSSNSFRGKLPVVSNLTAMNIWDGACMCFIYISLLEFICVNYVGRKRPLGNMVYKPKEPKEVTPTPKRNRLGSIFQIPLDTIEQEFLVALSSEKQHGSNSGRKLSRIRRKKPVPQDEEPKAQKDRQVPSLQFSGCDTPSVESLPSATLRPRRLSGSASVMDLRTAAASGRDTTLNKALINKRLDDIEMGEKSSKYKLSFTTDEKKKTFLENPFTAKKLPNFVDLKQKEGPHPIRVAKTIDVIARITFPAAYALFLIVYFIHYAK